MRYELHNGDNRDVLKTFEDNSIDSIVCDPPYELGFMGKKWDASGIAYDVTLWAECLRVLKPGGHLLAFGGSRTYHRLAVAIEDAGFEIRDCIMWLYGSGFPKSHDVSKALDKQAGAEREVVGNNPNSRPNMVGVKATVLQPRVDAPITAPATPLAQQWQGWGTALKPAHEPIVVARKPLQGTVADNVQAWGVGALNIDGCRVPSDDGFEKAWDKPVRTNISNSSAAFGTGKSAERGTHAVDISANKPTGGRWPANIILDEEAAQMLDEQSGVSTSKQSQRGAVEIFKKEKSWFGNSTLRGHSDSGGASRFFYVAKASKTEREAGLEGMEVKQAGKFQGNTDYKPRLSGDGKPIIEPHRANHHPTVKPIALMRYLVRMVTPRDGVVLDPFMGSGTTGCAAMLEAVRFIGIELNKEYVEIAEQRIQYWASQNPMEL